jgi:hypothetical protein
MSSPPDPSRIPDHVWEFECLSSDGLRRTYTCTIDGYTFRKTENLVEAELLEQNRVDFNDSLTKRFRDDAVGTKVASIPLNIFYRDFASRLKDGDEDFVKWWLNSDENRPYRTFRGKL